MNFKRLSAPVPPEFYSMTFPVYRQLLSLEPTTRHPEQGDPKGIRPLAIGAFDEDAPVGLLVGEMPAEDEGVPELLSVFTRPEARRRGVGRGLIARLEEVLENEGFDEVTAVYMTGKPSIVALERVLALRGWSEPVPRTVTLRFTPEEAARTKWFGRMKLSPKDYEIFSWSELLGEEREELKRTQEETLWIAKGLEPWRHDAHGFDVRSSLGLRYRGKVVGWVINHQVTADTVRFTCSFMRKDLGRRGRILPLYSESIKRLGSDIRYCMFITPVGYKTMVDFVRRRCASWATFFGETRGSSKKLN